MQPFRIIDTSIVRVHQRGACIAVGQQDFSGRRCQRTTGAARGRVAIQSAS